MDVVLASAWDTAGRHSASVIKSGLAATAKSVIRHPLCNHIVDDSWELGGTNLTKVVAAFFTNIFFGGSKL